MVSGLCWGWQLVLFIEMCSQSQPQYLQVLRIPWEGGIHRDSLRNSLCCFVLWLYENLYETEFSTPPITLSVGTPCELCRSWWFTPAIPASMSRDKTVKTSSYTAGLRRVWNAWVPVSESKPVVPIPLSWDSLHFSIFGCSIWLKPGKWCVY